MSQLLDQILELQSENRTVQEQVDGFVKKQRARDQSGIAWLIIIAFVLFITGIFLTVIFNLDPPENCQGEACNVPRWKPAAEFLLTVVSSVMLPIVTLVLGYYFGSEKNQ